MCAPVVLYLRDFKREKKYFEEKLVLDEKGVEK